MPHPQTQQLPVDPPLPARRDPPPDGWVTADEAAAVLGRKKRAIQLQCRSGKLAAGLFETPAGPAWYIDPACHPALRIARGAAPVVALADDPLAGLSADKRRRVYRRYQVVRAYRWAAGGRPAGMPVRQYVAAWAEAHRLSHPAAPRFSASTLYRWIARFERDGLAGLIDRRDNYGPAAISPEALAYFEGLYLRQAQPSIPRLYELVAAVAAGEDWAWPSLRSVQKHVAQRLDPKLRLAGRHPKQFRDRCLPHVERDWSQVPAMGCWVADHRIFDVLIPRRSYDAAKRREVWTWQRPWLTMYMDARSWMPATWSISFDAPDGNRTMGTFVEGVQRHGRPGAVYLDNGKDFRMYRFAGGRKRPARKGEGHPAAIHRGGDPGAIVAEKHVRPILEMLGVQSVFSLPYNAKAKIIEPYFRLVAEWFDKTWESYCGRRPDLRPEDLKKLKGRAGEYHAAGLTIENFAAAFDRWVTADYALRESPSRAAGGLSAARAFMELRAEDFEAVRPPAETLALLLMPSRSVRVEANGVYVRAFMQHYWAEELEDRRCGSGRDLRRKVTYRYLPDDPSAVWLFDATSDKYLCVARPYVGGGIHPLAEPESADADRLGAAMALQRGLAKRYTRKAAELRTGADNRMLAAARAAGAAVGAFDADAAKLTPPPAAAIQLSGDLDAAAQEVQAHREARRRQPPSSPGQRMRKFLAATGTDDLPAQAGEQPPSRDPGCGGPHPGTPGRRHALDLLVEQDQGHPAAEEGGGDPLEKEPGDDSEAHTT